MGFMLHEYGGAKPVRNAPYTAEAVSETTQVLADGNRIQRRSSTLLARDSEGRTRQEMHGGRDASIIIDDPVAQRRYLLRPDRKMVLNLPSVAIPAIPPVPPTPPMPLMADMGKAHAHLFISKESHDGKNDVQVQVIRMADSRCEVPGIGRVEPALIYEGLPDRLRQGHGGPPNL